MTPTYDQMGDWLEEIAARFPEAFFEDLDGGIQLEEEALTDPDFPPGEMYIMGEYVHDLLGRYILLYYGSFAALAVLEAEGLPHPPLEAVFTVDEEVGLEGAFALDCSDLKGRKLVNLDSEEEGVFTVSCAGGVRMDCMLPGAQRSLTGETGYAVTISGLQGGHSGAEIDKGRASANVLAGRTLYSAMERVPGLRLADIRGGKFDNVICPYSESRIAVPAGREAVFEAFIKEFDGILKNEYAGRDEGVSLVCEKTALETALSPEDTGRLLRTLLILPQGVQAMNVDFPGLVQTSLNMGVMEAREDGVYFGISVRSCIATQKEMIIQRLKAILELGGGSFSLRGNYPGWQFARQSVLRENALAAYKAVTGKEGAIEATHGGLECGLFIEKIPGLDAISMGPELHDVHSTQERLSVASTGRMYETTCELLKRSK